MKILTVSIAAYNVEKYIEQALDSLIDERIIDDLEIFVVDDGGTDRTLQIAKEYAKRYPRSIIPIHKENGGYGSTVNYTMAHATGKYFKLLDGDDWFDREALYEVVTRLRDTDVDVVFTPFERVYEGAVEGKKGRSNDRGIEDGTVFCLSELNTTFHMWEIIYKTEILKKSGLKLPEHMLYTDSVYDVLPMALCERGMFINERLYNYRYGRPGQSVEKEMQIRHVEEEHTMFRIVCDFYVAEKARNGMNVNYIRNCATGKYRNGARIILWAPVCRETLQRFISYETEIRSQYPEIYDLAGKHGKIGWFLWLCRRTRYAAYWLLKLIPGGCP